MLDMMLVACLLVRWQLVLVLKSLTYGCKPPHEAVVALISSYGELCQCGVTMPLSGSLQGNMQCMIAVFRTRWCVLLDRHVTLARQGRQIHLPPIASPPLWNIRSRLNKGTIGAT